MVDTKKLNQIEKKLQNWEKDLDPKYKDEVHKYVGRFIKKVGSGFQKIFKHIVSIPDVHESKQQRYLNKLKNQWNEIKIVLKETDTEEEIILFNKLKKMDRICELLLRKSHKVDADDVKQLRANIQLHLVKLEANIQELQKKIPSQDTYKELSDAIENNNINKVKSLISQYKDLVNLPHHKTGDLPLHLAVSHGKLEIAQILIPLTKDINRHGKEASTPLHRAVILKEVREEMVKLLLDHGADVSSINENGDTALHLTEYSNIVKLLLDKGANVKIVNKLGKSPLHIAAGNRLPVEQTKIINYLLIKGARLDLPDKEGDLPFHHAAALGKVQVLDLLMPENIDIQDNLGRTPLMLAASGGHEDTIKYLIEHKANMYKSDQKGKFPFHEAALKNHLNIMNILMPKNINLKDKTGRTALSWAAEAGNEKAVKFLLENKANRNIEDANKRLPFHYAAKEGQLAILEVLIPKFPKTVNAKDSEGRTALSLAASNRIVKDINNTLDFLLKHGAKKSISDKKGNIPFHYAALAGNSHSLEILRPKNIKIKDQDLSKLDELRREENIDLDEPGQSPLTNVEPEERVEKEENNVKAEIVDAKPVQKTTSEKFNEKLNAVLYILTGPSAVKVEQIVQGKEKPPLQRINLAPCKGELDLSDYEIPSRFPNKIELKRGETIEFEVKDFEDEYKVNDNATKKEIKVKGMVREVIFPNKKATILGPLGIWIKGIKFYNSHELITLTVGHNIPLLPSKITLGDEEAVYLLKRIKWESE